MKKIVILTILQLLTISVFSQTTFKFDLQLKPNSTYILDTKTETDITMDVEAKNTPNKEKKTFLMKNKMDLILKTVSKAKNAQDETPFVISYERIGMENYIDGKKNDEVNDQAYQPLYKVKINGVDTKNGRKIKDYEGPEEYQQMFQAIFKSIENLIAYPKDSFSIGQTNHTTNNLDLPLPNGTNLNIIIDAAYTLKKIENNLAYFDIFMTTKNGKHEIGDFNLEIEKYDLKGILTVNLDDHNITTSSMKGPMNMRLTSSSANIQMNSTYTYHLKSTKQ